jgi:hypothetical protein
MRLRLFRRLRLGVSRVATKLAVGRQPEAKAPAGIAGGNKGVGTRGSHRRTRGGPARPQAGKRPQPGSWPDPGREREPGGPATAPASTVASALSASAPGTVIDGTGRPPRPASWSSGPGPGQLGAGRPQAVVAAGARAAVRTRPSARNPAPQALHRAVARPGDAAAATARARGDAGGRPSEAAPWFETRRSAHLTAGLRHCGCLEEILCRDWAKDALPSAATVAAIDRLADLPQLIKEKLVAGLDSIYVGSGGVPDLDDMGELKGVALPSGRATWDACAGAYGDRKIVVGSRPSPTPDVMCHEIGHALDDIDGPDGCWQSDSDEFCLLYERCLPRMASEFHRQPGVLGKREFFADCFAAIASGQRPALVHLLSGDTRAALDVMLYFNVRYGI